MNTNKGGHSLNGENPARPEPPNPIARADATTQGTATAAPTPTKHNTAPGFDPWRFGTHDVPAELRQEILEKGFPDTPDDQLFTKRHQADATEPSKAAPRSPAEVSKSLDASAERKADTLRLRPKPPLINPFRSAAPWLVVSAVGVFLLLWMLFGRERLVAEVQETPEAPRVVRVPEPEPVLPDAPAAPVLAEPPVSATDVGPAAPEASASAMRAEPRPAKPKSISSPRAASPPRAGEAVTAQAPTPTPSAPKPSSSRWVPADD